MPYRNKIDELNYKKNYRNAHKEHAKSYHQTYHQTYKDKFFDMYGRVCVCCGEHRIEFLSIEHKQGQSKGNRQTGLMAYRKATQEYRPDLYEVLCMNCNFALGKFGYCPHDEEKRKQGTSEVSMVAYAQARTTTG